MTTKTFDLLPWQDTFIFGTADARYRAAVCGIGTGKTFTYLFEAVMACLSGRQRENIVIIRRTYKSLVDSTIADLKKYFNLTPHSSKKTVEFAKTGSVLRFLHGSASDISNLTNMSLTRFYIEQAEEYEDATVFDWLKDRLRGGEHCYGVVIANAKGHNWVWDRFINGARRTVLNAQTDEFLFRKDKYACVTGSSYANHNLPVDYKAYLDDMKRENPKRWLRMVKNSFDVSEDVDTVFTFEDIQNLQNTVIYDRASGPVGRIMGVDVARFGINENVAVVADAFADGALREVCVETWSGQDGVYTQGKIFDLIRRYRVDVCMIDCDGLGGPVKDNVLALVNNNKNDPFARGTVVAEYHNRPTAGPYANNTTEGYFDLKDLAARGKAAFKQPQVISQLAARKFRYNVKGQKILEHKKEWDNGSGTSPDFADAAVMCAHAAQLLAAPRAAAGPFAGAYGADLSDNFNY